MGGRENENMKKQGGLTSGNKIKLWKEVKIEDWQPNDGNRMGKWEAEKMEEGGKLIYGNKDKSLVCMIKWKDWDVQIAHCRR